MSWKIKTPCEKLFPGCYGDKPRLYEHKDEAERACRELNESKMPVDISVLGTFSFVETDEKVE